jgi:hypothetical protein
MKTVIRKMHARPWKAPRRKAFTPTGVTLGATVIDTSRSITGQVWAQAPTKTYGKHWWVVDSTGVAHECWERNLTALHQCIDTPLPQSNAA